MGRGRVRGRLGSAYTDDNVSRHEAAAWPLALGVALFTPITSAMLRA